MSKRSDRETEIQTTVQRALESAVQHYEENLEPDQVKATAYFRARPFGNEKAGRSKVVSSDVRDVTLSQLPSMLRIIMGPDAVVEYRAKGLEDEEMARQATDTVNYIVMEENDGFTQIHSWLQDGLVRRLGIVKWFWEKTYRTETTEYTGLTFDQIATLAEEGEIEILQSYPAPTAASGITPINGEVADQGEFYLADIRFTRKHSTGCARFEAVPPEEFVYTPDARSLDSSPLVAHVRERPQADIIAEGIDEDEVKEAAEKHAAIGSEDLEGVRQYHGGLAFAEDSDALDPSQRPVLYAEAYMLVETEEGKGTELRKFICLGPEYKIVGEKLGEPVDEVPFAVWTPYPEAHTIVGFGNADLVGDIQLVNSQVWRATLDSLSLSTDPMLEVVDGMVNLADVLKPDVNRIVRTRQPGMMREVKHQFVGGDTLPMLAYMGEVKENRTGTSKASAGLDADALQSSTKAAVAATVSGSQQRIEMLVRVFAETGMKRLFKGLLKLIIKHQDRAKVVRLRNKYVEVDPRHWDATMDVRVNVALGQGTPEDRINALASVYRMQLELLGLGMPFINPTHIRATAAKMTELAGWRNPEQFFGPWGPEEQEQFQQMQAQQPPPPSPEMAYVEIEGKKAEAHAMVEQAKLQLEARKLMLQDDRERDRLASDTQLRQLEIELKYQAQIDTAQLKGQIELERARLDSDLQPEPEAEPETIAPDPAMQMLEGM